VIGVVVAMVCGSVAHADLTVTSAALPAGPQRTDALPEMRWEVANAGGPACETKTSIQVVDDRGEVVYVSSWQPATLSGGERHAWTQALSPLASIDAVREVRELTVSVWIQVGARQYVAARQVLHRVPGHDVVAFETHEFDRKGRPEASLATRIPVAPAPQQPMASN